MTVKKLIEELQDFRQDAQVITSYFIGSEEYVSEPCFDYDEETNVLEIF